MLAVVQCAAFSNVSCVVCCKVESQALMMAEWLRDYQTEPQRIQTAERSVLKSETAIEVFMSIPGMLNVKGPMQFRDEKEAIHG